MLKKRIPTIIGLLLLIVGTLGGVIFINQGTDFLPRAAPEFAPQKVKITNLTESGFTVSWITQESTIGFVRFGDNAKNLSTTVTDDRDQLAGSGGDYRTHYITLQNLKPAATYYFKLGSQKNQLYDNNGQPFAITTPPSLSSTPPADMIYGTVVTPANTPAEGAIVYLSLSGATPVSALVKQNGSWVANLTTALSADLSSYAQYDPQTSIIDILVQSGTGEPATAKTTTGNDQPVPTITLGQVQDFTSQVPDPASGTGDDVDQDASESEVAPTPLPDSKFTTQSFEVTESNDATLNVTSLPTDGATVNSTQPEIKGVAPANATLVITVHSPTSYTDQVQVDQTGKWQWTPPQDLEPGEHTLTISYIDTDGVLHKMTRLFVVNAAGTATDMGNPSYSATPSATATPRPSPTPQTTPSPSTAPTPSPASTPVPSPTPRSTTSTASAALVAGSATPTLFTFVFGLILVLLGSRILLPSRQPK